MPKIPRNIFYVTKWLRNVSIYLQIWSGQFQTRIFKWYMHTACISFWIPRRQAISTDTSFEIKMTVKIYAIEIIFKSPEPFQSSLLPGQADSDKKAVWWGLHFLTVFSRLVKFEKLRWENYFDKFVATDFCSLLIDII